MAIFLYQIMNLVSTLANYHLFNENHLKNRFLKHSDVLPLLSKLPSAFTTEISGKSVLNRTIHLVKWGNGATKIMLWSQMHGNEATGTMALFDFFNFLQSDQQFFNEIGFDIEDFKNKVQLFIIPMVNPDGAEIHTRRNAQQIDINRDYLQEITPEGKLLKQMRNEINPHFGFNLHDQTTLWSVTGSLKPASLSYLAPAFDSQLSINSVRENAMSVIADMFNSVSGFIPGHIGLFDDEYEPRAFGDNFQNAGTSTILIEAGGYENDFEKQELRKYYFASILSGLISIANKNYEKQSTDNYFKIPKNNKQIFHILINDVILNGTKVSIGINYDEKVIDNGLSSTKEYSIADIGDLSFCDAYESYKAKDSSIVGSIIFDEKANFSLVQANKVILSFENGKKL
jgi:hypothetical protein